MVIIKDIVKDCGFFLVIVLYVLSGKGNECRILLYI